MNIKEPVYSSKEERRPGRFYIKQGYSNPSSLFPGENHVCSFRKRERNRIISSFLRKPRPFGQRDSRCIQQAGSRNGSICPA
jgi:hypothetical protein